MQEAPIRRKQADRSAEARRKILAATVELIGAKGLEGFSLADVGERAGVSRALPGHYFKSRDKLVREAVRELLAPVGRQSEVGLEHLLGSLEKSLAKIGSPGVQALLITLSAPASRSPAPLLIARYWEAAERWVEDHLRARILAGEVRGDSDAVGAARLLVAAIYGEALICSSQAGSETAQSRGPQFIAGIRKMLTPAGPAKPPSSRGGAAVKTEAHDAKLKRNPNRKPATSEPQQTYLFGEALEDGASPEEA
jgi:AcrR family transcriptional regulator